MDNFNHAFFSGLAEGSATTTLPLQTISDSKKSKTKFQKDCMDALEAIGIRQKYQNMKFRELYQMTEGDLVYSDYDTENSILDNIRELGDKVQIPAFVKHYDFIGIIANQLSGEWINQADDYSIQAVDEISNSEFIRERTRVLEEAALQNVNAEIQKELFKKGLDPNRENFQSQEEQQAYMQMLQEEQNKIMSPKEIEKKVSKDFKTVAAKWGNLTLKRDKRRFHLENVDKDEAKDFFLTGRFFRHYFVGYDHYKPERWDPIDTFFSEDVDAKYPQDGEYVGRVFEIAPTKLIERYGDSMTPKQIKQFNNFYQGAPDRGNDKNRSFSQILKENGPFGQNQTVPFHNYYDYDLGMQYQNATGQPMGELNQPDENGETVKIPTWLSPQFNGTTTNLSFAQHQRGDINVRTDQVRVTEAYWKSWKRMWFFNYVNKNGVQAFELVTDDILPELIEEYQIKKIRTKSIREMKEDLEPNTMYEVWVPEVWKGVKIVGTNSLLSDPIYLDVNPLEYQIRGDSNVFDVKLPVGGIITNSPAKKMRPYQVGFNICWNQIFNLLEKEIGTFFLFDINFLPSEYRDQGTAEDALYKIQELAKNTGLVPIDTKKGNLQGANDRMNTFMAQDISFDKQIQSRVQLAQVYYQEALKQIGITPQRMGAQGQYETATGVEQGTQASFTQTLPMFTDMSVARKKCMELHLSVAQYCQSEYIDVDMVFDMDDLSKQYLNLTDPDFPLRRLGLHPMSDPKKRQELNQVKQAILNDNTMDKGIMELIDIVTSDTALDLRSRMINHEKTKREDTQAKREHEKELQQMQIEAQKERTTDEREYISSENEKDRRNRLQIEAMEARGRALAANKEGDEDIDKALQQGLKEEETFSRIEDMQRKSELKEKEQEENSKYKQKEIQLKEQEQRLKEKKMNNDRYIAEINKN